MYNDENNNISRPRFDSKTGEPIHYDDEAVMTQENAQPAQEQLTQQETQAQAAQEQPIQQEIQSQAAQEQPIQQPTQAQAAQEQTTQQGTQSQTAQPQMSWQQTQQQTAWQQNTGTEYRFSGSNIPFQNEDNMNNANKNVKKEKSKNKKSSFGKKAAQVVGSAAVFGLVAGCVMYGVYYAGAAVIPVPSNKNSYEIQTVASNVISEDIYKDEYDNSAVMNVQSVAASVMPAMVALSGTTTVSSGISSYFYGGFGGQSYEAGTSGTGIIVGKNDTELLIVTNAHVVDGVNNLACAFADGESVSATVKGSKSDKDIAVVAVNLSDIKSSTLGNIAIAELADSENLAVGQQVVAIGNALGEGQSVTSGIISAMDRSITVSNVTFSGLIMTDAAINSGNSGGALLNSQGKVVAINFAKTSEEGVEGMAYSIPVSNVRDIIDTLMNRETRTKVNTANASYLGIIGSDISSTVSSHYDFPQGILIRSVEADSPAAKAGLGAYDIIVSFDDQSVSSMSSLTSLMEYYAAGESVKIEYYHLEGSEYVLKTVEVTLGKKN